MHVWYSPLPIILLVILLLVLFAIPGWPHTNYAQNWGYYPGSIIAVVLLVLIVLLLVGVL